MSKASCDGFERSDCTPRAGVSMTGVGERILVKLAAKRLCDLVADGAPLLDAARRASSGRRSRR